VARAADVALKRCCSRPEYRRRAARDGSDSPGHMNEDDTRTYGTEPGAMALRSGYDDYLDTDRVVGASRPGIPGREGYPVLFGGQCHERVIHGAARDAEAAQRSR